MRSIPCAEWADTVAKMPHFLTRCIPERLAMQYRRLGRSGLQVSELSLGSWATYHKQVDTRAAVEMLAAAIDAGINFFDNAEGYEAGQSEVVMGQALKTLNKPRLSYLVSTKFYW